jgi:hypothetical protein
MGVGILRAILIYGRAQQAFMVRPRNPSPIARQTIAAFATQTFALVEFLAHGSNQPLAPPRAKLGALMPSSYEPKRFDASRNL